MKTISQWVITLLLLGYASVTAMADTANTIRFHAPSTGWTTRAVILQANYPITSAFGDPTTDGFGITVTLAAGGTYDMVKSMRTTGSGLTIDPSWAEDGDGAHPKSVSPSSVGPPTAGGAIFDVYLVDPPPSNTYGITNKTSATIVLEIKQNGLPDEIVTLRPNDSLNVTSTNAFTISDITTYIDGLGEFATVKYKTNLIANYSTPNGSTVVLTPPPTPNVPSSTNTPTFSVPTNDTQKGVNATINEIRNQTTANANDNAALLAELKKLNAKNVFTNQASLNATDSNAVRSAAETASNTASNNVRGATQSYSNSLASGLSAMNGTTPGSPGSMTVRLGHTDYSISPLSGTAMGYGCAFAKAAILWAAKLLLIMALFKEVRIAWAAISKFAAGTSTSGWLQAVPLSLGQAVSTLVALGTRWAGVAFAVAAVGAVASGVIASVDSGASIAGAFSAASSIGATAFSWVDALVPIAGLFSIMTVFVIGSISILGITLASSAMSDATGKL